MSPLNISPRTGMKCLPAAKLYESNGIAIHDWHAEVLTLRAFNHFLLREARTLALDPSATSPYLRRRPSTEIAPSQPQPFAWNDALTLHMYCSEAPCGDASMELVMAAQDDASPWDLPSSLTSPPPTENPSLPGRGYFSQLGVVRRKPARGDAPPSLSKSCSDKIALKQCTSLLNSLSSLLISPWHVYLTSLILPEPQYSAVACHRCFSAEEGGRMAGIKGKQWGESGYGFVPFRVETTKEEFVFSKRAVAARTEKTSASNLAVVWTANGVEEGLVGGVLQGRKQFVPKGASVVSRRGMWKLSSEVAALTGGFESVSEGTYGGVKGGSLLETRREVKEHVRGGALKGWVRNTGGDAFGL
ncbi:hypothetical protein OQA88_6649 [Cercophora sp. LCS_1]